MNFSLFDSFNNWFDPHIQLGVPFVYFGVALFVFFLFGVVVRVSKFKLSTLYQNVTHTISQSSKANNNAIFQNQFVNQLLTILFIINLGVLIHFLFFDYLKHFQHVSTYMAFVLSFVASSLIYFYNQYTFRLVIYFFAEKNNVKITGQVVGSVCRLLGMLLSIPALLCLLIPFRVELPIIVLCAAVFSLTLVFILVHLVSNFLVKPVSAFYLILYLCTLEIAPIVWGYYFVEHFILNTIT